MQGFSTPRNHSSAPQPEAPDAGQGNQSYDPADGGSPAGSGLVGQTLLGRYRILSVNDEGGFGTVCICWDTRLQRRVAIKRMPLTLGGTDASTSSTLEEALNEARTSGMLSHPNIVTVYDFETDARSSYLVMECVDGLNLQDLLARVEDGVLTYDESAHVLQSVASALAFAHENGVLHLDIKPANIMIDRSGAVKLTDFGMATLASAAGYGGARGGTVGYMPPEQIVGDYVDERSDVFSLAVVVWETLTGICPFRAATAEESLEKIRRGPSPMLSKVEPELAGIVEETLLRALAPEPGVRMASVTELAQTVVPALGSPSHGRASLGGLVRQAFGGEGSDEPSDDEPHLTLGERMPWLYPAISHAAAAVSTGAFVYRTLPFVATTSSDVRVVATLAMAGAAAAWTPLGSVFALGCLVLAVSAAEAARSLPLGLALAALTACWWVGVGRHHRSATTAAVLPSCLAAPSAGGAVAGITMPPLHAALTSLFSWFVCELATYAWSLGLSPEPLLQHLGRLAASPVTWLGAAGCTAGAALCSLISRRGGTGRVVVGEAVCFTVVAVAQALASRMENGGISTSQTAVSLAVALGLGVIMCTLYVLIGPEDLDPEGKDQQ